MRLDAEAFKIELQPKYTLMFGTTLLVLSIFKFLLLLGLKEHIFAICLKLLPSMHLICVPPLLIAEL
jgi:hypothetical protein